MSESEAELAERKKRTKLLIAGGAVSLVIPLLGALYLHFSDSLSATAPTGRNDVFEHREGLEKKITPSQAVSLPPPASSLPGGGRTETTAGSSLDFIKPTDELKGKMNADAPKASTATAAPAPPPPPPAPVAAAKTPAKKGPKAFQMPKLQPTRGFNSFGGSSSKGGGKGASGAAGAAGADPAAMLNNLPPGAADNPQIQQMLKGQQH